MAETNKTEKATPKKRKDERKKGNAFQSKDLVSVVVILVGFFIIRLTAGFLVDQIQHFYASQMVAASALTGLTTTGALVIMRQAMMLFFITAVPLAAILSVAAFVAAGAQTRFLVSADLLKFKYNRISMLQGFKRMFSLRSVVQLVKSLIKVAVILYIIFASIEDIMVLTPDILNTGMQETIQFMGDRVMSLVYKICLIFVGVAVLDFAYEKYDYEKKLMMTKQEIKDEYKQTEGDPFIKGKIKEKQRKLSMNRMIQQVPQADVIVRNPTHFAVALKYDPAVDPAPRVLAKGQDLVAKRILQVAEEHHLLITENKPLARALYESVEVNDYVPAELYQMVAEVMAWVYGIKKKGKN